eukprot:SAG11_NODE_2233_length_3655_cov_2.314961_4_plen_128_part_00
MQYFAAEEKAAAGDDAAEEAEAVEAGAAPNGSPEDGVSQEEQAAIAAAAKAEAAAAAEAKAKAEAGEPVLTVGTVYDAILRNDEGIPKSELNRIVSTVPAQQGGLDSSHSVPSSRAVARPAPAAWKA